MNIRKILKFLGIGLLLSLLIGVGLFYYGISTNVDKGDYDKWYAPIDENISDSAVTVQFVGVSTMLISDGTTKFMTDGFFTRLNAINLIRGYIKPNTADIKWAVDRLGIETLDGIFVVHSHFDHAMDAPEVARLTGATMYGSESTANIGRGWNLSESQIALYQNNQPIQIGKFKITPILSNHYEFPDPAMREQALGGNQEITEPLVPPVPVMDYKMGGAYTLFVEHPKGNFVIQSSAGWKEHTLDSIQTDIAFMGIGGLGGQTEKYQATYFKEVVDVLQAKQIYIIHWDAFVGSITKPIQEPTVLVERMFSGNTKGSFEAVEREVNKRPGLKVNLLPQWEKVVLFE